MFKQLLSDGKDCFSYSMLVGDDNTSVFAPDTTAKTLFAYDDCATVLVVFSIRLNSVAVRADGHAACIDATFLKSLSNSFGTKLSILFVDACVTGALIGITVDSDSLARILVAPFNHLVENNACTNRVALTDGEEDCFVPE